MAWRRLGDKPLSESMMVCLLTLICVTRPQWPNVAAGSTIVCKFCSYSIDLIVYVFENEFKFSKRFTDGELTVVKWHYRRWKVIYEREMHHCDQILIYSNYLLNNYLRMTLEIEAKQRKTAKGRIMFMVAQFRLISRSLLLVLFPTNRFYMPVWHKWTHYSVMIPIRPSYSSGHFIMLMRYPCETWYIHLVIECKYDVEFQFHC